MTDDWSPDKEFDPEKFQAEASEFLKELMEERKAEKARKLAAESALKEDLAKLAPLAGIAVGYRMPTFQELSDRIKRAWEETRKIAPDAPHEIQAVILQALMHHVDPDEASF